MTEYTNNRNHSTFHTENPYVKISLLPEAGGRIIGLSLGEYQFLYFNPDAKEGLHKWKNIGGEKIWPAPQGWSDDHHWPGPAGSILDYGNYECIDIADESGKGYRVASPYDETTGIISSRDIILSDSSAVVNIKAKFTNLSNIERRWSIWPVCQIDTSLNGGVEPGRFRFICPINNKSIYRSGFKIMHGVVNNPQFGIGPDNLFEASYSYIVGKAGLDSDAGWVYGADSETGKVIIFTFQYEENAEYPDDTSVQIWFSGKGAVYSGNMLKMHLDNYEQNPPYAEIELLSPLKTIDPGKSAEFSYSISMCTVPKGKGVREVHSWGVISEHLNVTVSEGHIVLSGFYGFFLEGYLSIESDGEELIKQRVSPNYCCEIEYCCESKKNRKYSAIFYDLNHKMVDCIEDINI